MIRSIRAAATRLADLMPGKDRGHAHGGDKRAAMILGDNSGAAARLTITAIEAGDAAEFGRGVYLQIEGYYGADLAGEIAKAAAIGDGDICIFLNEPAKANLLEQLEQHRTIMNLQDAQRRHAAKG